MCPRADRQTDVWAAAARASRQLRGGGLGRGLRSACLPARRWANRSEGSGGRGAFHQVTFQDPLGKAASEGRTGRPVACWPMETPAWQFPRWPEARKSASEELVLGLSQTPKRPA